MPFAPAPEQPDMGKNSESPLLSRSRLKGARASVPLNLSRHTKRLVEVDPEQDRRAQADDKDRLSSSTKPLKALGCPGPTQLQERIARVPCERHLWCCRHHRTQRGGLRTPQLWRRLRFWAARSHEGQAAQRLRSEIDQTEALKALKILKLMRIIRNSVVDLG